MLTEWIALLTGLAACLAALVSLVNAFRLKTLHLQLNSRMDELLVAAKAQGVVAERAAQDARDLVKSKRRRRSSGGAPAA